MPRENATTDPDSSPFPADPTAQSPAPIGTTATIAATRPQAGTADADGDRWNALTIIGQGTPSSFELTVDGQIELADENGTDVTVRSGTTVEGTVESDTVTFRFSGDLTDVTFVDRGITGEEPATTPNVHVDYGAVDRS